MIQVSVPYYLDRDVSLEGVGDENGDRKHDLDALRHTVKQIRGKLQ